MHDTAAHIATAAHEASEVWRAQRVVLEGAGARPLRWAWLQTALNRCPRLLCYSGAEALQTQLESRFVRYEKTRSHHFLFFVTCRLLTALNLSGASMRDVSNLNGDYSTSHTKQHGLPGQGVLMMIMSQSNTGSCIARA